jgi:hypothetical protein
MMIVRIPEREDAMSNEQTLRRSVITTAILAALSLGGVLGASADTYVFRDIRKPGGHEREMAAKLADGRAGASKSGNVHNLPVLESCMRAHGWVVDHIVPDSSAAARHATIVHFDDIKTKPGVPWRGNAALQNDTRSCSARGTRDYESQSFKRCMLDRGWQYTYAQKPPHYAQRSPVSAGFSVSSHGTPWSSQRTDDAVESINYSNAIDSMNGTIAATNAANAAAVSAAAAVP